MTEDIIERLYWTTGHGDQAQAIAVMCEAADEIERLRKVLAIQGLNCKVVADIERQQAQIGRLQEELRAVLLHVEDLRAEISVYKFRITQLEDDLIRAIGRETGNDTTARNSGSAALRDGAGG